MKREKRIYCIEGHWDWGEEEVEPSVEPMLQVLRGLGYWQYARRDCVTEEEMRYWLNHEWKLCAKGSVLYLATHGEESKIVLSDKVSVHMTTIGDWLGNGKCPNCWVHFGGCNVLELEDENIIKEFMTQTGATVVSGYAVETGWIDTANAPALALELMLFSSAHDVKIENKTSRPRLHPIADDLKCRFKECGFRLHTKESVGL